LRESAWVRGLARALLGEGAAADDLAQDVLVAALDGRPGLEGSRLRGLAADCGAATRGTLARAPRTA
jgi:DNA-directed RNA polymerase specialized sigma24 family protein